MKQCQLQERIAGIPYTAEGEQISPRINSSTSSYHWSKDRREE